MVTSNKEFTIIITIERRETNTKRERGKGERQTSVWERKKDTTKEKDRVIDRYKERVVELETGKRKQKERDRRVWERRKIEKPESEREKERYHKKERDKEKR